MNHVVFCLYAGGVRNLESVHMNDGDLMPNLLNGNLPVGPIAGAMEPLPTTPLPMPLQNYGTLFKEFHYDSGPTGHYNGHTVGHRQLRGRRPQPARTPAQAHHNTTASTTVRSRPR